MDQRLWDYIAQYKGDHSFIMTEREQCEVCGVTATVTLYEYESESEHSSLARILLEKDGLRYECEGTDRTRWDFFPVTVEGKPYILFTKTLYGFTLLDPDTLTEAYDFFPEKVCRGEESFIITHAQTFGKYLIFDGCYWGAPYEFAAYDPAEIRFVTLTEAYGVLAGDHTAEARGDHLILRGLNTDDEPAEVSVTESHLDRLMAERGTADF